MWPRPKMICPSKESSFLPSPVSFCCGEMIVEDHCCSLEHPRSLRPDCLDLPSSLLLILTHSHSTKHQSQFGLNDLWLLQHLPNNLYNKVIEKVPTISQYKTIKSIEMMKGCKMSYLYFITIFIGPIYNTNPSYMRRIFTSL